MKINILTSFLQRRLLTDMLKSSRQFVDTVELTAGYRTGRYAGLYPILPDKFVPDRVMYLNNHSFLSFQQSSDWDFMQEDGAVLKHVSGTPNYEAILFKFGQLVTPRRNAFASVVNLSLT
jgi:hypothetical protein